ncbi:MAG TPA: hypothetical protein VLJ10_05915, partial [Candidatus Bathyarchaeia archaeon]|nr:hypothetical protein [Candidatus Bathyarchaeia archaeon]
MNARNFRKRSARYLLAAMVTVIVAFNIPEARGTQGDTAVGQFIAQVSASSDDPNIQKQIIDQTEESKGMLTDFLGDLVEVMASFESQNFSTPTVAPAQEFINKWADIKSSCTDCI